MRRILSISLILFAAFLLVSCSDEDNGGEKPITFDNWNDPKSPNYHPEGYNPILGEWRVWGGAHKDIYTEDFQYLTSAIMDGVWTPIQKQANYIINDKKFKLDTSIEYLHGWASKHDYWLSENGRQLTVKYPGGGTMTYNKCMGEPLGSFDDWNDPKSPNYQSGGYNAIMGKWVAQDKETMYIFTWDFKFQRNWFENGKWREKPSFYSNYIINDKAFQLDREFDYRDFWTYTHNYTLSEDGNKLTFEVPGVGVVNTFERYED